MMQALALLALAAADPQVAVPAGPAPEPVVVALPAAETPVAPSSPAMPEVAPPTLPAVEKAQPMNEGATGEIVVNARAPTKADPLAELNAKSFDTIQSVDKAVIGPVAMGYEKGVPSPVRSGLRNFLRNLDEPVSFLNYILQLKPKSALKSLGRFTINTTVGVGGLMDVAKKKPFNLPYKPNGFANTFACYGIGNGPFLFLPLVGPITLRDLTGLLLDKAVLPTAIGKPFNSPYFAIPSATIDSLNDRIEMDGQLNRLRDESADPYVATRALYLKQRKAEVSAICPKKGDVPIDPTLPPRVGKGVD